MTELVRQPLPNRVSEREACDVLALCRNSVRAARARYHFMGPASPYRRKRERSSQPRALSEAERSKVTEVLTSDEYADQPPAQVYYSLLQQGIYLCSISTMHRLLRQNQLNGERRQQHKCEAAWLLGRAEMLCLPALRNRSHYLFVSEYIICRAVYWMLFVSEP